MGINLDFAEDQAPLGEPGPNPGDLSLPTLPLDGASLHASSRRGVGLARGGLSRCGPAPELLEEDYIEKYQYK